MCFLHRPLGIQKFAYSNADVCPSSSKTVCNRDQSPGVARKQTTGELPSCLLEPTQSRAPETRTGTKLTLPGRSPRRRKFKRKSRKGLCLYRALDPSRPRNPAHLGRSHPHSVLFVSYRLSVLAQLMIDTLCCLARKISFMSPPNDIRGEKRIFPHKARFCCGTPS